MFSINIYLRLGLIVLCIGGCDSQYYVRFLVRVSIFPDRIGSTGGLYPVWNGPVGSKIDADHEFCWRGKTVKAHPFTQTSLLS